MGLIFAPNLVLSPEESAIPPGTPRILWRNIVTASNVSADSEADGFPAVNLANPATNQEWRAAAAGDVELTVIPGSSDDIDAGGFARHNFGTAGIAVEPGYYDNDSPPNWVSLADPQVPPNDEPLMFVFTAQPLTNVVVRLAEGSEAARAAVLYVGKSLLMERGVDADKDFATPRFARKTEFAAGQSERGDYLGRIPTSQWIAGIEHTYSHLRPDWYREHVDPFVRAGQRDTPFFYAFRPDQYPYEVAFCWFADDPVPMTNPATQRKRLVLNLAGIVE